MDPTTNLDEQLQIANKILDSNDPVDEDDAIQLAELVESLHHWISNGGFLPKQWQK